ncbi:2,3-dihydro-2,3-dihydroxybenzoate dehydrogenase [Pseudomonas sp. 37 R 15]|uniref:2,3-dihydro-2,3-dihydroxybenzoate dehydrogenase n=1 Tax=Pseudomonas sp. 37 R 15 TaxID=1844104 RepID=UPI0008120E59|nr:2,3-dihydro-2,3-dihydroxybenzoate dehydrogenase [Pseudomonas sp. 37 R 15]CRM14731.1 2,3-dihydro-2,3-dihydroxybenzoate dehydrogenase [Pseudomonas sp. 37 R 15]
MNRFEHQSIVVTGAAQGIGAAITRLLLQEGADVFALDNNAQALAALADEQRSPRLHPKVVDITRPHEVEVAIAAIDNQYPLTGLVNNAGVLVAKSIATTSAEEWQTTFEVNVHGTFFVSRAVASRMAERGQGAIVTVASNAGSTPRINMGAYCSSKAAAAMLTRCIGLEFAAQGIRCNVVSPGSTRTSMLATIAGEGPQTEQRIIAGDPGQYRLGIPLQKIAEPQDIAAVVAFLLSGDANHITLQNLVVDGGATFE